MHREENFVRKQVRKCISLRLLREFCNEERDFLYFLERELNVQCDRKV